MTEKRQNYKNYIFISKKKRDIKFIFVLTLDNSSLSFFIYFIYLSTSLLYFIYYINYKNKRGAKKVDYIILIDTLYSC
jgi:hypothetical protein